MPLFTNYLQYLFRSLELGEGVYWVTSGDLDLLDEKEIRCISVLTAGSMIGSYPSPIACIFWHLRGKYGFYQRKQLRSPC